MKSPTVIHRYAIPKLEAVEMLTGLRMRFGQFDRSEIRLESGHVVIDIFAPATDIDQQAEVDAAEVAQTDAEWFRQPEPQDARESSPAPEAGPEPDAPTAPQESAAPADSAPEARKGGALAQTAGIICGQKGFWTFAGVASADQAAAYVRAKCGVTSRAELDHDPAAGAAFRDINARYKMWLDGVD